MAEAALKATVSRRTLLAGAAGLGAVAAGGTAAARYLSSDREQHPAAAAATRSARPAQTLSIVGAPGTLGGYLNDSSVDAVEVAGWGFGPGQAAYMSAVAADGTVFVGTTPFTDNQAKPTAAGMELAAFDPTARRFTRMVIPSTTGQTVLGNPNARYRGVGGGDVADVLVVPEPDPARGAGERVVFLSEIPYFGWNAAVDGQLPTLGQVVRDGADGPWHYEPSLSYTAQQLAAGLTPQRSAAAFPVPGPSQPPNPRGPASIARLPRSGHLVVAQYFGYGQQHSGALLVVDLAGQVRAFWQYPEPRPLGLTVLVRPREVTVDPTSAADDERFALISDCYNAEGKVQPFTVQEFSYSASTGTIRPMSTAVRAAQDGSRMETACFDAAGTLFVARTRADGLTADRVAVYPKIGGERGLVTRSPAVGNWPATSWGTTCRPDHLIGGSGDGGLVRSLTLDPASGGLLLAGVDGSLMAIQPEGAGRQMTFRVGPRIDLGLDLLRRRSTMYVGLRRGAVDAQRRLLWLPVNQLVLDAIEWPYPPFKLDQWLLRIDLARLPGS